MTLRDLWAVVPSGEQVFIKDTNGVALYTGSLNDVEWDTLCSCEVNLVMAIEDCLLIRVER